MMRYLGTLAITLLFCALWGGQLNSLAQAETQDEISEEDILALDQGTVDSILDELIGQMGTDNRAPDASQEQVEKPLYAAPEPQPEYQPEPEPEPLAPVSSQAADQEMLLDLDLEAAGSQEEGLLPDEEVEIAASSAPMLEPVETLEPEPAVAAVSEEPEPFLMAAPVPEEVSEFPAAESEPLAPTVESVPPETSALTVQDPLPTPSRGTQQLIVSSAIVNNAVAISRQYYDHLLITVGDMVFLPTPSFKTLQPLEKYFIYKRRRKYFPEINHQTLTWFEQVGKLKILEINDKLSIGRIIEARDIIQKGDLVLLRREP